MPLTQNIQQPLFATPPNCWKCQHFGLTYEPRMPYLCRMMGIKTRSMPSAEVMRVDGQVCHGFSPKPAMPMATAPRVPAAGVSARSSSRLV